jgi:NAD(P)-dependent dehydrogenase (short-subunit alcohol dehydrogenase family)
MKNVTGKVAFITGGASGIGLGMARAFVRAGMRVVIADASRQNLERASAELGGDRTLVHTMFLDVLDRKAMASAADEAERVFGKVHVLCPNAGVGDIGYIKDTSYDDWDWIMGVTFGGVVNAVTTFLPRMRAHGEEGHIVATSSMAGITPVNHGGVYSVAKTAVVGMMEALRMELAGSPIGVSVLCPGMTRTNIRATVSLRPERYQKTGYTYAPRTPPPGPGGESGPMQVAMDAAEVGEKVLRGIRRNDLYILSHAEFGDLIREHFDAMLRAMPPPSDPPAGPPPASAGRPSMATPYRTALGSD